jgi:hypothetical protein
MDSTIYTHTQIHIFKLTFDHLPKNNMLSCRALKTNKSKEDIEKEEIQSRWSNIKNK